MYYMEGKGMLKEFKEFAFKGNVVDMAVGVMIGGAFGKIVTSAVNDLFMPLVSLLTGGLDFTSLFIALDGNSYPTLAAAQEAGAACFAYGSFITTVLDFLIMALHFPDGEGNQPPACAVREKQSCGAC